MTKGGVGSLNLTGGYCSRALGMCSREKQSVIPHLCYLHDTTKPFISMVAAYFYETLLSVSTEHCIKYRLCFDRKQKLSA